MNSDDEIKVCNALNDVHDAQNTIARACRHLNSVAGFGREYGRLCKLHDAIKEDWHRINDRRAAVNAEMEVSR